MKDWRVWVAAMMVLNVAGFGLSWTVNTHAAQRAVAAAERERQRQETAAAAARTQQQEVTRAAVCAMVIAQEAVYADAQSPVGKNAAAAWHDLRKLFQC